jgi:hypothetical protein
MIGALLLSVVLGQVEGGYRWETSMPGESVQYGVAGTDDRALRIDCRPGRGLVILGPAPDAPDENRPVGVVFRRGEASATLLGVTVFMGDGLNFAAPVLASELPIVTLLAGEPLTVEVGEASWVVPGAGAPEVLRPLVEGCRVSPR